MNPTKPHRIFFLSLVAGLRASLLVGVCACAAWASPVCAQGNLLAAVNGNHQNGGGAVFEYTPAGAQSAFLSSLDRPRGLVFDSAGNLFVATTNADPGSGDFLGTVFKVSPSGSPAVLATFGPNIFLQALVIDMAGNVFVMAGDFDDPIILSTIFKISPAGTVTTFGVVGGLGFGLAFDSAGNLFAAGATDRTIYKFTPAGVRSVFAGPTAFTAGPGEGPNGLAFDRFGNLFASATYLNASNLPVGELLEFSPTGTKSAFASGLTNNPRGLAFDGSGNLFVAETAGGLSNAGDILKFTTAGVKSVFASGIGIATGNGGPQYLAFEPPRPNPANVFASINGTAQNGGGSISEYAPGGIQSAFLSGLDRPRGLLFDGSGNLFVSTNTANAADSGNIYGTIFKVTPDGTTTIFATGFAANIFLEGLAMDNAGNVFVVAGNQIDPNLASTIYKIAPNGTQTPFASLPGISFGLAFDSAGNLFAGSTLNSDGSNPTIYKFTPTGVQSTFADSTKFLQGGPVDMAFDGFGNLFVSTGTTADPGDTSGTILTFTSTGTKSTFATGLKNPRGLVFDSAGHLFVAEVPVGVGAIREFNHGGTEVLPTFALPVGGAPATQAGGPEFLVFPPNTSAGSNTLVNIGPVGSAVIALTFPQITVGGKTTVTPIDPSSAGTLPSGYELAGGNLAFEITTTATYTTPPIIVAFQVLSVDAVTFSQLRVLHNEGGTLVDRTATDPAPNPTTQTVYASVSSLSPFVIAKVKTPTNANQCKSGGWQMLFRANGTRFKNQGDCIQYVNTGK